MKILVLDNYDSFTYNIVHYLEKVCDFQIEVFKNNEITINEAARYSKILLSPGPGLPSESGIMPQLLKELSDKKNILGVCLGLQAVVECFGGKLYNPEKVFHGIATPVQVIKDDLLFKDIPKRFLAGRYHSWIADRASFPENLEITAVDDENNIMAVAHKSLPVKAVQFHPESILSEYGEEIFYNWINS